MSNSEKISHEGPPFDSWIRQNHKYSQGRVWIDNNYICIGHPNVHGELTILKFYIYFPLTAFIIKIQNYFGFEF